MILSSKRGVGGIMRTVKAYSRRYVILGFFASYSIQSSQTIVLGWTRLDFTELQNWLYKQN